MLLELFYLIPLMTLVLRAVFSSDGRWARIPAVALAIVALAAPWLETTTAHGRYLNPLGFAAAAVCSVYLVIWSFLSRDSGAQRLTAGLIGAAGLLPILLFFVAMANYTE